MLALACCALALPEVAAALPLCDLTGDASFTPVHPQATDVIGFNVTLSAVYSGPPQHILSKATIGPGPHATLDIVVTTDAMRFGDYEFAAAAIEGSISRGRGCCPAGASRRYWPGQTDFQLAAVQRFYGSPSAGLDSHFFSIDYADQFALTYGTLASAWVLETDNAFEIGRPDQDGHCAAGQIPVYRLWNRRVDSNHRYTINPAIKAQMIERGYVAEGYGPNVVDMCALVRPPH